MPLTRQAPGSRDTLPSSCFSTPTSPSGKHPDPCSWIRLGVQSPLPTLAALQGPGHLPCAFGICDVLGAPWGQHRQQARVVFVRCAFVNGRECTDGVHTEGDRVAASASTLQGPRRLRPFCIRVYGLFFPDVRYSLCISYKLQALEEYRKRTIEPGKPFPQSISILVHVLSPSVHMCVRTRTDTHMCTHPHVCTHAVIPL